MNLRRLLGAALVSFTLGGITIITAGTGCASSFGPMTPATGKCTFREVACSASSGGGCCPEDHACKQDGEGPYCVYQGSVWDTVGASRDGGQTSRVKRVY